MTESPMLHVEEATKAFGGILALNRVSFDVNQGDILGIIGPNGSGKTTLVNCITGFVTMTSGKIFFKDREITGKPAHKIADLGVTRTFQIMRPYYSLAAYKNLVIAPARPRAGEIGVRLGQGSEFSLLIAVLVTLVCLLPEFLILWKQVPFYFGGTSLLIVVGVAMDTINQVEAQLIMRHYEGFTPRAGRIRGRRSTF